MIKKTLFDLTHEQIETSKNMYGKIVKCLISTHHSYHEIKDAMGETPNIMVFPERDLPAISLGNFIENQIKHDGDLLIITSSVVIISDIPNTLTRILTKEGKIEKNDYKTFANFVGNMWEFSKSNDTLTFSAKTIRKMVDEMLELQEKGKLKKGKINECLKFTEILGDRFVADIITDQFCS